MGDDVQPAWEFGGHLPDWANQFLSLLTGMQFFPLDTSESRAFEVQQALQELPTIFAAAVAELGPITTWLPEVWDAPATQNFQQAAIGYLSTPDQGLMGLETNVQAWAEGAYQYGSNVQFTKYMINVGFWVFLITIFLMIVAAIIKHFWNAGALAIPEVLAEAPIPAAVFNETASTLATKLLQAAAEKIGINELKAVAIRGGETVLTDAGQAALLDGGESALTNAGRTALTDLAGTLVKELGTDLTKSAAKDFTTKFTETLGSNLGKNLSRDALQNLVRTGSEDLAARLTERLATTLPGRLSTVLRDSVAQQLTTKFGAELADEVATKLAGRLATRIAGELTTGLGEQLSKDITADTVKQAAQQALRTKLRAALLRTFATQSIQNIAATVGAQYAQHRADPHAPWNWGVTVGAAVGGVVGFGLGSAGSKLVDGLLTHAAMSRFGAFTARSLGNAAVNSIAMPATMTITNSIMEGRLDFSAFTPRTMLGAAIGGGAAGIVQQGSETGAGKFGSHLERRYGSLPEIWTNLRQDGRFDDITAQLQESIPPVTEPVIGTDAAGSIPPIRAVAGEPGPQWPAETAGARPEAVPATADQGRVHDEATGPPTAAREETRPFPRQVSDDPAAAVLVDHPGQGPGRGDSAIRVPQEPARPRSTVDPPRESGGPSRMPEPRRDQESAPAQDGPVHEPARIESDRQATVDESQPAADSTNGAAGGGRQPEAAQHHPAGADQPVGPEPRPAHHAPAESATARPLHSTTDGREKQEAEGKAFRADVTDRSEQITKKYAALRNAQDDLPEQIPPQVMKRLMRNAIDNKDMVTQLALLDEEIRRTKGYRLTWTQLIAGRGLIDGTLDQPAGEGKTEAFDFAAVHHALSGDGSMLRLTSSRTLAGRDAADFAALARRFDIRVETVDHNVRIQKRYRPTVYVSDVNELGFYHNRWGEKVPTDVLRVDEVDTLDPDKVFIQSTGNDKLAGSAITDRVDWVHNAISEHRFTDEDFGPNGRLTEGGQSKLRDRLQADGSAFERARGEARRYNGFEDARNRLEQAQAAGRLKEGKDYLIYRGPDRNQPERLVIIDQATGEPLYDAHTNLEQRWEKGLAQAVEKKHGIDVHADAESTKPLTLKQVLDEYSNKGGASGTAEPHAEVLKELGFKDVTKIYRLNRPRLEQHPDSVHATEEDAFEGMVDDIVRNHFQPDEDGILQYVPDKQPTQVIVHRNDWIDSGNGASKLKDALIARGIPEEKIQAMGAEWIMDQGTNRDAALAAAFKRAGEPGMITITGQFGGRGTNIRPADESYFTSDGTPLLNADHELAGPADRAEYLADPDNELHGGLRVYGTARSDVSARNDIQLETRAARKGDPGESHFYGFLDGHDLLDRYADHPAFHDRILALGEAYRSAGGDRAALDHVGREHAVLMNDIQTTHEYGPPLERAIARYERLRAELPDDPTPEHRIVIPAPHPTIPVAGLGPALLQNLDAGGPGPSTVDQPSPGPAGEAAVPAPGALVSLAGPAPPVTGIGSVIHHALGSTDATGTVHHTGTRHASPGHTRPGHTTPTVHYPTGPHTAREDHAFALPYLLQPGDRTNLQAFQFPGADAVRATAAAVRSMAALLDQQGLTTVELDDSVQIELATDPADFHYLDETGRLAETSVRNGRARITFGLSAFDSYQRLAGVVLTELTRLEQFESHPDPHSPEIYNLARTARGAVTDARIDWSRCAVTADGAITYDGSGGPTLTHAYDIDDLAEQVQRAERIAHDPARIVIAIDPALLADEAARLEFERALAGHPARAVFLDPSGRNDAAVLAREPEVVVVVGTPERFDLLRSSAGQLRAASLQRRSPAALRACPRPLRRETVALLLGQHPPPAEAPADPAIAWAFENAERIAGDIPTVAAVAAVGAGWLRVTAPLGQQVLVGLTRDGPAGTDVRTEAIDPAAFVIDLGAAPDGLLGADAELAGERAQILLAGELATIAARVDALEHAAAQVERAATAVTGRHETGLDEAVGTARRAVQAATEGTDADLAAAADGLGAAITQLLDQGRAESAASVQEAAHALRAAAEALLGSAVVLTAPDALRPSFDAPSSLSIADHRAAARIAACSRLLSTGTADGGPLRRRHRTRALTHLMQELIGRAGLADNAQGVTARRRRLATGGYSGVVRASTTHGSTRHSTGRTERPEDFADVVGPTGSGLADLLAGAAGRPTATGLAAEIDDVARARERHGAAVQRHHARTLAAWGPDAAAIGADLVNRPEWTAFNGIDGQRRPAGSDRTGRRYYRRGGLLPPLRVQQELLEKLLRDEKAGAHPKRWRRFIGAGGTVDAVISAVETFRGRPTAAAERTTDGFHDGDPSRPITSEESGAMTRLVDYTGGRLQLLADCRGLSTQDRAVELAAARQAAESALGDAGSDAYRIDIRTYTDGSREVTVAFNIAEELVEFQPPQRNDLVCLESLLVDATDAPVPFTGRALGPSHPSDRPVSPDYFHHLDSTDQLTNWQRDYAAWETSWADHLPESADYAGRPLPVRDRRLAALHERAPVVAAAAGIGFEPAGIRTFTVTTARARRFTAEVRLEDTGAHSAVTAPLRQDDLGHFVVTVDSGLSSERVLMTVADQLTRTAGRVDLTATALEAIDAAAGHCDPAVLEALRSAALAPARPVAVATVGSSPATAVENERDAAANARAAIQAARSTVDNSAATAAADAVERLQSAVLAPDALSLDSRVPSRLSLSDQGAVAQLAVAAALLDDPTAGWRRKRAVRQDLTGALGPMGLIHGRATLLGTSGQERRRQLLPRRLRHLVDAHGRRDVLVPPPETAPAVDDDWLQDILGRQEFRIWIGARRITLLGHPDYGTEEIEVQLPDGTSVPVQIRLGEPRDSEDPSLPAPERDSEGYLDATGWHITLQPGLTPATTGRELAGQLAVVAGTTQDAITAGADPTDLAAFSEYVEGIRQPENGVPWTKYWVNGYLHAFLDEYDRSGSWMERHQLKTQLRRDLLPIWNLAKRPDGGHDALSDLPAGLRQRISDLRSRSAKWAADPKPRLDVAALARDLADGAIDPRLAEHIGAREIRALTGDEARALGVPADAALRVIAYDGTDIVIGLAAGPLDGVGGELERIAERRRHGTGLYLARLFQRQTIEDAGLALHYLLASAIAQTQSAGQTLPATRDRIAHSPGNVALLAAVSDRYRAARGFRARRALRAAAAEIVGRMDRHTLEDLDPELFRFVDKMLRPSRRRSEFDETLTKTRQDVAERSYPSRIPTLRRYLQKRVITYGSQALAGVGLSFLFGKLYFSSAAPFIHGSPKDLVFAGLAVLLGVGAGVVHARADHASNRSTEAADLARRAAEERRRARKAGDPTAAFGGLAADAVSGAVSDVHRQLKAGTRAQERLTELLQELQPRLDSGQVTPANIAAAMPASAPSSTSAARPAQRRRVTPSPWAQADRPIPGRTPPYNVYFRKNLTPGIAQVVTSIALTGFGAGAWPYTGVVTLGNALHMIFDPLTKMRIAHFAQVNTSTRRQQERARDERHHRSREVAAAKMATALLLDVPDVQRSLAWADATQRLVAALEVVADPAAHPGETAPAGPSGRVDLVPPAAAPLHMAHRTTGPLENLLAAAPAELITGFGSGIPALWINGPAGATQVGIALLNVLLAFPSEGYGFQKYYGALDVAHAQYALELEQDRRAATVAFTHSAGMRLAERIEAALQELPPETVQQIDSLRSEVLSRIGWKAAGPPEPVGRVVASYAQSRPSPSLRPPFRHQLWRDLPAGVAQAVLGMAVAATWPGLSAAEATEQGITAAANNGLNGIVKWAINGFAMTDEVRGYNAQLLYERLSDIQQTAAAAQAHLRALQPAIDDMAAAVAEHRAASDGAVEAIRDFLSTYPAGGGRHRRTDGEPR